MMRHCGCAVLLESRIIALMLLTESKSVELCCVFWQVVRMRTICQ